MGERETLEKLRELIRGGFVERVELNQHTEGLLTFFVRVGAELREVPIFATDLGWWIAGERVHRDGVRASHTSIETMLQMMSVSALYVEPAVEPLEDEGFVGFRFVDDSKSTEFWIPRLRCTGPWASLMLSERGRLWIAEHPGTWDAADPREVRGIDDPWRE